MEQINKPYWLFFAEWASSIGIFIVCFVFLFHQVKVLDEKIERNAERQGERTDRLYEMWCDTQKEIKQIYVDRWKESEDTRR